MYFIEERVRRICSEIEKYYIYPDSEFISGYKMKEGTFKGGEVCNIETSDWDYFECGKDRWGAKDKHYWFRTEVTIPEKFSGKPVVYELKTGREGEWDVLNPQFLVYVNGNLIQGLDINHREIILSEAVEAGQKYFIALYAYTGMKGDLLELNSRLLILDREAEKLYYNIKVPLDVAAILGKEDKRRLDILDYLNNVVNLLDLRKAFTKNFYLSIIEANDYLNTEFYEKYCGSDDIIAYCVGHTHIDVAWLWTIAQTREKAVRSFSTVLSLMKQYPEYKFMSSQPQLYKFVKEDHPEIYEEIKERIKEGRWEAEGGMWLEADCNLISGESMVRQLLFGTRFFQKEFGVKNEIVWLPDVFGYNAAMPQILKKSGINYFMTSKISWSEYNKMPSDTFMWKGLDGTEVFTHLITGSYVGDIDPKFVKDMWDSYHQKSINNEILVTFGYGDGGGGPTKEMLERGRRLEKGIPGVPKTKIGNPLEFFKEIESKVSDNKKLPNWVGELYLEYHRGTYTSMARNKKFNRKSEFLFVDAELLSSINSVAAGGKYSKEKLNSGWKTILLNQFHDIIPGSSIKQVYEDSDDDYSKVFAIGNDVKDEAINAIASKIDIKETSVVVFNQLSFNRNDVIEFELPSNYDTSEICVYDGSKLLSTQSIGNKVLFFGENIPAKGYKTFTIKRIKKNEKVSCLNENIEKLDNKFFTIKFDKDMNIISLFDKVNNRQVLKKEEKANTLFAFEDKPHNNDAWDINVYYQEKMWEINEVESVEIGECGPVRSSLIVKRRFLDSTITQTIYVYNDIPRIDFKNIIDWKEKQILVKVAFPVDVHAEKATYEIQYGNVERPTHWNTSWDFAKFEVCGHKWADISEDDYGVSILNDCKYGYDIKDSVMRLTLLKSAVEPNEDADREVHEFTYSLYPHRGNWKTAGTAAMAYNLNCPMYSILMEAQNGIMPTEFSLININKENVFIEVVKEAEDSEDLIVRMYEYCNRRANVKISLFTDINCVYETDLMENDLQEIVHSGNNFDVEIKPFEIKTFKVRLKK